MDPVKRKQCPPAGEQASGHWSEYWSGGFITSLPQDFAGNYDGEIRSFWEDHFAALPADAQLLDVCTGNGAVALLAAAWSRANGATFDITAMDAARLDPEALARQHPRAAHLVRSIRFLGETPLETCRFPAASFDLVTSQYGIEYCRLEDAARQVARLLKPGGQLVLLAHEAGSDMVTTMQAERDEYALLQQAGVFEALEQALSGKSDADALQTRLAALESRLAATGESPLFANVLRLVRHMRALDAAGLVAQRPQLVRARDQLRHARARLEDMLRVNRMIADEPDWHRVFERHGLVAGPSGEILYRGRHRSGRFHCYRKPLSGESA